jgi:hypothetical protein
MKKRPLGSLPTYDARVASLTGHHCPQTGWWLADEDLHPRFISEGDVMPGDQRQAQTLDNMRRGAPPGPSTCLGVLASLRRGR